MSTEDADRIVRRMARQYRPFKHLHDEDLQEEALKSYRQALAPFDEAVLERAWQMVVQRHRFPCWPYVPEFLDAARQAHRELRPAGDDVDARSHQMADDYWRKFAKSAAAVRAREGNYERELKAYVLAVARVQGQYILGRDGIGYDNAVLFPGPRDRDAEEEFFRKAREQAATGGIKILIPPAMVKRWQAESRSARSIS